MSLKMIKLLCVVEGNVQEFWMNTGEKMSLEIDYTLWQKFHVFVTMTFRAEHDVEGHVNQALLEYTENHMSEFDEQIQELCSHDTRGINDVFVGEE